MGVWHALVCPVRSRWRRRRYHQPFWRDDKTAAMLGAAHLGCWRCGHGAIHARDNLRIARTPPPAGDDERAEALGDWQPLRAQMAAADRHEPEVDHLGVYCGACDWMGGAGFVGHALSAALDRDAQGSQEARSGPVSAGDAGDGRGHGRDDEEGRGVDSQ